jgi:hypothetical protein
MVYEASTHYSLPLPKESRAKMVLTREDEGTSVADSHLVGQSPRGTTQSKNLLKTMAAMNRELGLRHDRAEFVRQLSAIHKTKGDRADDIRVRVKMQKVEANTHTQRAPNSIPVQRQQGVDVTAMRIF